MEKELPHLLLTMGSVFSFSFIVHRPSFMSGWVGGIVTENHFRGQKRNGRKRKNNPLLTAKTIIHILTLTTST
jgi:hypothetical protein